MLQPVKSLPFHKHKSRKNIPVGGDPPPPSKPLSGVPLRKISLVGRTFEQLGWFSTVAYFLLQVRTFYVREKDRGNKWDYYSTIMSFAM